MKDIKEKENQMVPHRGSLKDDHLKRIKIKRIPNGWFVSSIWNQKISLEQDIRQKEIKLGPN